MDLEKLGFHIRNLAVLEPNDSLMISCYLNHEAGRTSYRGALDTRISEVRDALPIEQRFVFEEALAKVEAYIAAGMHSEAKGVALFARGGESPFFQSLQFRVPLPNQLSVDSLPHLYELVALKDTYHRYVVLISTESHARIVEVNVGNVTKELWAERPELRQRVGREWTKEHYQSHRRDRARKFIKEKIEILDRLFSKGSHTHLILAGNARTVARVRESLPKRLLDKLVDVVPAPGKASTAEVVRATLSAFALHEESESLETAGLLLDELRKGDLAVAGTQATVEALSQGQVDVLVMSESYSAPPGWTCRTCKTVGITAAPVGCPVCGERDIAEVNIKEQIIGAAERSGASVEVVRNSDVLFEIGGVGCLLRYLRTEQRSISAVSGPA